MAEKEKNKDALLQDTLKQIEKQYGKGSIMKLGDRPTSTSTPSAAVRSAIDYALGIGGYPKGRIIEIYGPDPPVKRRWRCTRSPSARKPADGRRLSTQKTRSTRCTRRIWASRSTI